jgi:hypothetical protein
MTSKAETDDRDLTAVNLDITARQLERGEQLRSQDVAALLRHAANRLRHLTRTIDQLRGA